MSQPRDPAAFIELALARAAALDLALAADDLSPYLQPDPLGLLRASRPVELASGWAPQGWLPTAIGYGPEPSLDWAHFGGLRLTDPFYEGTAQRVRARPFNLVFQHRTRLADLAAGAPPGSAIEPAGLVFHLSRCGSTLATQMLAAVPGYAAVSEAAAIDAAVQIESIDPAGWPGLLAAVVAAMSRRRFTDERRLFLKLDAWHAMRLPLFRQAFPTTPWVFLYRDPLEVLVSQAREPGPQIMPGALPASVFGCDVGVDADEHCALVLAGICEAVLAGVESGGGRLVNYVDLPDAVASQILPHFGEAPSAAERTLMAQAALRDVKTPSRKEPSTPDSGGQAARKPRRG